MLSALPAAWGCSASTAGADGSATSDSGLLHDDAGGYPDGGTISDGGASQPDSGAASDAGGAADAGTRSDGGAAGTDGGWWNPASNSTFYWDLTNAPPDNTKDVGAYDIDGWNNTSVEVSALHALGKKAVCYMDVGTYEPGRPDSSAFPASLLGNAVQGWPGEYWLDVRPSGPNYATLQSIMTARFQVCQSKGFDAVEPDNIDSYANNPGFPTTAADQLAYNEWVATTVHGFGMAVLQKNDLDQISSLLPYFDGLLDEECNKYAECGLLAPYVSAGKPVWDAEYTQDGETTAAFCPPDIAAGIVGALFSINLDGSVFQPCANDVGLHN